MDITLGIKDKGYPAKVVKQNNMIVFTLIKPIEHGPYQGKTEIAIPGKDIWEAAGKIINESV